MKKIEVLRGYREIRDIHNACEEHGAHVLGGYVRYMCSPLRNPFKPGDVDIYSPNAWTHELMLNFLSDREIKHENDISVTYKLRDDDLHPPIQLIKPQRKGAIIANGPLEEILDSFDFTICRIGLINETTALADDSFLEDEKNRHLVIKNIHCPISSTLRAMKYSRKGYFLKTKEALKLFMDWMDRDDDYRNRIIELLLDSDRELTKEEIEELEELLRID